MSIDESGLKYKIGSSEVTVTIFPNYPLIKLANALDWEELKNIILPDLKASIFKGKWSLGRKLKIRIHLAIYILQQLYNKTDRKIEYSVKDNAAFQIFCGKEIIVNWHCPDHTKIEEFRSRLTPNTQNQLANEIAKHAFKLGYGNASCFDINSTICEANMSYPTDSYLLLKLGKIAHKVWSYTKERIQAFKEFNLTWDVNIKEIRAKARTCFFDKANKKDSLYQLWDVVCHEVAQVLNDCRWVQYDDFIKLPWNIKRAFI